MAVLEFFDRSRGFFLIKGAVCTGGGVRGIGPREQRTYSYEW